METAKWIYIWGGVCRLVKEMVVNLYVNIYGQDFGQYGGEKKDKIGQKFLFYRSSEQEKYIKKDK